MLKAHLMLGHAGVALAIDVVGHAHLDGVEGRKHVELGHGDVGEAVDARGIVGDRAVKPAATTTATGGHAVLIALLGQRVASLGLIGKLGGHGARTDAGDIGLHDAQHAIDVLHADAGAGNGAAGGAVGRRHVRIGAVVDVEQRRLGALKQQVLALVDHVVEQQARLGDVGAQALGHRQVLVANLVHGVGGQVVDELELGVHAGESGLQLVAEQRLVQHVLHAQANAGHLVLIARTDAALGGTDVLLAELLLKGAIQIDVVRHDDMRVATDLEVLGGDAVGLEHVNLLKDNLGVDDAAVTDHRHVVGIHDAGRHLVQAVLLAVDDDGVTGVVAARVAHDSIEVAGDQVANLTLALIAPLGTDQNG